VRRGEAFSQDQKCYACGRPFRRNSHGEIVFHPEALTIDGQRQFVGADCMKRIVAAGAEARRSRRRSAPSWSGKPRIVSAARSPGGRRPPSGNRKELNFSAESA
jgi:hypothetical protein